jgi:hypothetical protein
LTIDNSCSVPVILIRFPEYDTLGKRPLQSDFVNSQDLTPQLLHPNSR